MGFDPAVWGPHYWFFLQTIAESYPTHPNQVTKRKYYDLIQNFPLFIPDDEMGNRFSECLDKYPVSPYLGTRDSFVRWVNFIHNKINVILYKPEMSLVDALAAYRDEYKAKPVILNEQIKVKQHVVIGVFTLLCIYFVYLSFE
uniref:thiol oxidase n=1 Tax=viral metagenome TaxID=1070528 RepID=A0A6C0I4U2_9ZZZZ